MPKKSERFELDNENYETHTNFKTMRDNVRLEMVRASVTKKIYEHVQKDREGSACEEKDTFVFKVNHGR